MPRNKIWNLRLNLDNFNALFVALNPAEFSEFLDGLCKGMNNVPVGTQGTAQQRGNALGLEMRQEAEGLRLRQALNGVKGGSPTHNVPNPLPTMYPECTQPPTQSVPNPLPTMYPIFNLISKDVLPSDLSSASPLPAEVPKRKKKLKTPTPSLAEILGGKGSDDWNNYWLFASCWPKAKNANARSLAEAWMEACKKDEDIKIYEAALEYQKDFLPPKHKQDDSQFMKSPLTWLKEEAWLNAINHQGGD